MKYRIFSLIVVQLILLLSIVCGTIYLVNFTRSESDFFENEKHERFEFHKRHIVEFSKPNYPKDDLALAATVLNKELADADGLSAFYWSSLRRLAVWIGVGICIALMMNVWGLVDLYRYLNRNNQTRPPG